MAEGIFHRSTAFATEDDYNAAHLCPEGTTLGKVRLTAEGGIAVKMTNRTGTTSVKGTLVGTNVLCKCVIHFN